MEASRQVCFITPGEGAVDGSTIHLIPVMNHLEMHKFQEDPLPMIKRGTLRMRHEAALMLNRCEATFALYLHQLRRINRGKW